jgi:hypothetical protein
MDVRAAALKSAIFAGRRANGGLQLKRTPHAASIIRIVAEDAFLFEMSGSQL